MGISPWVVGDLAPILTIQVIPDSGYLNTTGLSTSNFTLVLQNVNLGTETNGQGTFSNLTPATLTNGVVTTPASIQYQMATNDVSTVGLFHLYLKVQIGASPQTFDIGLWQVVAS